MSTIWTFDGKENKYDVYRRMFHETVFCESLREDAIKIINFEKKKNDTINKRTEGIIQNGKNLQNFQKEVH